MNRYTEQKIEEAMKAEGCTDVQIRKVLQRLASVPTDVRVSQSIHTVEAGSTVIGYQADTIG